MTAAHPPPRSRWFLPGRSPLARSDWNSRRSGGGGWGARDSPARARRAPPPLGAPSPSWKSRGTQGRRGSPRGAGEPPSPVSRSLGCSRPLPREEGPPGGQPPALSSRPAPGRSTLPHPAGSGTARRPPPRRRCQRRSGACVCFSAPQARTLCGRAHGDALQTTPNSEVRETPTTPGEVAKGRGPAPWGRGRAPRRLRIHDPSQEAGGVGVGGRWPRGATPVPRLCQEHMVKNRGQVKTTKRVVRAGRAAWSREARPFITHTERRSSRVGGWGRASPPPRAGESLGPPRKGWVPQPPRPPSPPRPRSRLHHPRRQEFGENAVSRSPPRPRARLRQLRQHVATAKPGVCSPFGWFCGYTVGLCIETRLGGEVCLYTRFFQTFIQGGFVPHRSPGNRREEAGGPGSQSAAASAPMPIGRAACRSPRGLCHRNVTLRVEGGEP